MSILVDSTTRTLVQGATGLAGRSQVKALADFGTPAVGGVTPGRGGSTVDDVPIFDTVDEAVAATGATASVVHVPPGKGAAADAAIEAIEAGIETVVLVAEGIPVSETLGIVEVARHHGATLVGPNCVGLISPGRALVGMLAPSATLPGNVGLISKSGSLVLETLRLLSNAGIGQSTVVSMGGDPILGTTQAEYLELFEADPETESVIMLCEIGGSMEIQAAEVIRSMTTPVFVFVAGTTAPIGRRMGHLGAISSHPDSAKHKVDLLRDAGAHVLPTLWDIRDALRGGHRV